MTVHHHHLPGRLRLRFTQLKHQHGVLDAVVTALRHVHGVYAVEGSAITGGVLIHYDTVAANAEPFWRDVEAVLLAHHLQHDPRPLNRQRPPRGCACTQTGADAVAGRVARGVTNAVFDKLIERSAVALVAALL